MAALLRQTVDMKTIPNSRVPCIMRWPGKIPFGTTSGDMLMTIDLLPTIAKITKPELYHLKTNVSETTNVADINPEVVAKLLEYAARIRAELGDALTQTPPAQAREPGRLNE